MKKTILAIALVTGLTTASVAQNSATPAGTKAEKMKNASPQQRATHESKKAEKDLGLTADQKTKWEAASLERITANAPLRDKLKGATTPEERKSLHAQAKVNHDKFDATVNAFLTPEQKTKFEQIKKDRKEKRKGAKEEHDEIQGN